LLQAFVVNFAPPPRK